MSAFEIAPLLELFDDDRIEVANLLSTAARSVSGDVALVVSSNDARSLSSVSALVSARSRSRASCS